MSQSHIKARPPDTSQYDSDWMREIAADAANVQQMMNRLDQLAIRAHHHTVAGDKVAAGMRIEEIREGLQLVGQLMGIKVGSN